MNSINLSNVINSYVFDLDKVASIHWESEREPYDTAIIAFTDTRLRARVTEDVENHVFLFSIFWWTENDDPIYTDGCVEYSESLDSIDAPESVLQETAWNLFKEIRTVIHQYAPRFA